MERSDSPKDGPKYDFTKWITTFATTVLVPKQGKRALLELSEQLQHVMQLHLETENLVVGVPGFGKEVTLLEVAEPTFVPHHKIEQVVESAAGYFIKLKVIKTI